MLSRDRVVQPAPPRATVFDEGGQLRIVIPAARNWPLAIFLSVWLCGWTIGEVAGVLWTIGLFIEFETKNLMAPFWLTFWTLAGMLCWQILLWLVSGREMLTLDDDQLIDRYRMRLLSHTRAFDVHRISRLRAIMVPAETAAVRPPWVGGSVRHWGVRTDGHIAFDYGGRSYAVGAGLDEAEAKQIVRLLLQRRPELSSEHER